jgi:hypothetical protein
MNTEKNIMGQGVSPMSPIFAKDAFSRKDESPNRNGGSN